MLCYVGYVSNKLLENSICFHETKFLQVDHDVTFGKILSKTIEKIISKF